MSKTNYTKMSIEDLKKSAKRSAYAQLELGYRFEVGMDIDQSYQNAEEMYKMASAKGLADATKSLVELYSFCHVKTYDDIDELIFLACSQYSKDYDNGKNQGECAWNIYDMLYSYLSDPQLEAADKWLKKAIEHQNFDATTELGRRYLFGENKKQSFKKALKYYQKAQKLCKGFTLENIKTTIGLLEYNVSRNIDSVPEVEL